MCLVMILDIVDGRHDFFCDRPISSRKKKGAKKKKSEKTCFFAKNDPNLADGKTFKILWKFFLLSMYLNAMYGAVRDRRCLWIVPKTDQKISIMNILNDNLTYNAFIPQKRFLALVNWNSTYFLILHGNFTRDAQKYQLWIKICEFDPKII